MRYFEGGAFIAVFVGGYFEEGVLKREDILRRVYSTLEWTNNGWAID